MVPNRSVFCGLGGQQKQESGSEFRAEGETVPDYVNSFKTPVYIEVTIVDGNSKTIGTIRVKPSGVLWKRSGSSKFYSVSLDDFVDWITASTTKAKKTTS